MSGIILPAQGIAGGSSLPFVTVTPFGPTDGGNDGPNTPGTTTGGIQEAINSLGTSGGMVFISKGNYTLTSVVNITNNGVTIQGQGIGSTNLIIANSTGAFNVSGWDFALQNLQICSNGSATGYGLSLSGGLHYTVANVQFGNATSANGIYGHDIVFPSGHTAAEEVFISGCTFYNNNNTTSSVEIDAAVQSLHIYENEWNFTAGPAINSTIGINFVYIIANTFGQCFQAITMSDNAQIEIISNSCTGLTGGVTDGNNAAFILALDAASVVAFNVFDTPYQGGNSNGARVMIIKQASYSSILHNKYYNNGHTPQYGILLGVSNTITNCLMEGNDFSGCSTPISSNATLTGCTIRNNPGYNPVSKSSATAGSSPYTFPALPYDAVYVITTVGGLSALTLDGTAVAPIAAVGDQFYVAANHVLIATWAATAPVFEILPI